MAAETKLRHAKTEREARAEKLERYRERMVKEKEQKWTKIMGATMKMEGLDKFWVELAEIDRREVSLEKDLMDAQKNETLAQEATQKAKGDSLACHKALEKLIKHRQIWQAEVDKENARLEDLEAEEFKTPKKRLA
jgi:hypothetical protein